MKTYFLTVNFPDVSENVEKFSDNFKFVQTIFLKNLWKNNKKQVLTKIHVITLKSILQAGCVQKTSSLEAIWIFEIFLNYFKMVKILTPASWEYPVVPHIHVHVARSATQISQRPPCGTHAVLPVHAFSWILVNSREFCEFLWIPSCRLRRVLERERLRRCPRRPDPGQRVYWSAES